MYIYDKFGIRRKISDFRAVDNLLKLKSENGSNPWPVIEECLRIWEESNPKTWQSFLFELDKTRQSRRDKFASSDPKKDKRYGGIVRYTLDVPEKVIYMIRCIYTADELPMNKEFFHAWARKFPRFQIAEKI